MTSAPRPSPPDTEAMRRIADSYGTKSDKIRALARAGYSRSQIAEFLGVRYQYVWNVLRASPAHLDEAVRSSGAADAGEPEQFGRFDIDAEGRIALPPALLRHLQLRPGGVAPWRLEGDELVLLGLTAGVRRAQEIAAKYPLPGGKTLTDLLFEERRADARTRGARGTRAWLSGSSTRPRCSP